MFSLFPYRRAAKSAPRPTRPADARWRLEAAESELDESAAELDAVPEAELSSEVDEAEELLSLSLSLSLLSLSEELVEEELDEPLVSEASESDDEVVRVVAEARPPVVPSTTEASV